MPLCWFCHEAAHLARHLAKAWGIYKKPSPFFFFFFQTLTYCFAVYFHKHLKSAAWESNPRSLDSKSFALPIAPERTTVIYLLVYKKVHAFS